jgi:hypothetical protein
MIRQCSKSGSYLKENKTRLYYKDQLIKEVIAVYCENHTKHINLFCGDNAKLLDVKVGGTYSYPMLEMKI